MCGLATVWQCITLYPIDGQFLLKSNQLGPFPLAFSVRPDTFLARTVCAVTPAELSEKGGSAVDARKMTILHACQSHSHLISCHVT